MKNKFVNGLALILISAAALALAGCWTAPNANVQPTGTLGLIQSEIMVESVQYPATVQAMDNGLRTITLVLPDGTVKTYKAGPNLKNFDKIQPGETVKATVTDKLAVYGLENGRLPDGTTAEALGVSGKVLQVDPSYRLLTVQFPNGQTEIFKPGLQTLMQEMSPGDSVVIRPVEVTKIKVKNQ
jgi:hypothetical protein